MDNLDQLEQQGIPKAALSLIRLQQQEAARRRSANEQRAMEMEARGRQPLVDPFFAAMAGLSSAPEQNMWGGAASKALEAQTANAQNRQALELKAAELRGKSGDDDLLEKMAPALMRSAVGRSGSMGKLPNGNEFIKSGDRVYEIIPDKNVPEGYRMKEVISAGKSILGADTQVTLASKMVENTFTMLEKGGAFEGWDDTAIEQWKKATFDEAVAHLNKQGTGLPGAVPPLSPTANPPGTVPVGDKPTATPTAVPKPQVAPPEMVVPPATQSQRDGDAFRLKQREMDDLVTQRDALAVNDPKRNEINAQIANLRKEAPKLVVKGGRQLKQGEGYGAQEGADLAKERKGWGELYQNNMSLESTLTNLRQLYSSNADIASGQFADQFKALKSGLVSIGIGGKELENAAAVEDVITAITGKMALSSRTSEGTNLMPGAMSDFEQKVLRSLQPMLSATPQGRLQMIDFMVEIARSHQRMSQAATEYEKKNGRLDSGWNAVRERKAKEEMARMSYLNEKIRKQYGGRK